MAKQNDSNTTISDLKKLVITFMNERDWGQYHNPKNLSMDLAVEAAEIMEIFQWVTTEEAEDELEKYKKEVAHELADVTTVILNFCERYNIDLASTLQEKMKLNAQKYPTKLVRGNRTKYNQLKKQTRAD